MANYNHRGPERKKPPEKPYACECISGLAAGLTMTETASTHEEAARKVTKKFGSGTYRLMSPDNMVVVCETAFRLDGRYKKSVRCAIGRYKKSVRGVVDVNVKRRYRQGTWNET